MKRITLCLVFSAAVAALTSCGKIEKEPTPDRTINKLTTTSTTTTATISADHALTTTMKADTLKVKKMSFSAQDETDDNAVPQPVVTVTVNVNTNSNTSFTLGTVTTTAAVNTSAVTESEADNVTTTTATTENISTEFSDISGEWVYQKRIADNQYINNGYINIADDGTFELYISESRRTIYGYTENDGNNFYSFCENSGIYLFNGRFRVDEPDVFYFTNKTARMIKGDHISDDFNIITGEWEYQEIDRSNGEYTTLGRMKADSDGSFTYYAYDGNNKSGNIILQSEEYPDGTEKYFFAFCENGDINNIWKSCLCEQNEADIFYAGNGGESRFARANTSSTPDYYEYFAYGWYHQEYDAEAEQNFIVGHLTIDKDGHYTYTPFNGDEEKYGIIKSEIDEFGNNIISFYDYGQYFWMSCEFEHQRMFSINILSDDPDRRYKGALFYDKFETAESYNFGGQWGSSDGMGLSIICVRSMEGYDVVVYSTICIDSENHIYGLDDRTYFCLYDETTDSLVCDGKGKHKYIKYYDDYVYELLEEVNYGACSSVFRFEDKNIVWENTDTGEVTVLPPVADAFPEM